MVMMSADHGGLDFSHGRWADTDLIIPLMMKGNYRLYLSRGSLIKKWLAVW